MGSGGVGSHSQAVAIAEIFHTVGGSKANKMIATAEIFHTTIEIPKN